MTATNRRGKNRSRYIELLVLVGFVAAVAIIALRVWGELSEPTPAERAAQEQLPRCSDLSQDVGSLRPLAPRAGGAPLLPPPPGVEAAVTIPRATSAPTLLHVPELGRPCR